MNCNFRNGITRSSRSVVSIPNRDFDELQFSDRISVHASRIAFQSLIGILMNCNSGTKDRTMHTITLFQSLIGILMNCNLFSMLDRHESLIGFNP